MSIQFPANFQFDTDSVYLMYENNKVTQLLGQSLKEQGLIDNHPELCIGPQIVFRLFNNAPTLKLYNFILAINKFEDGVCSK